METSEKSGSYGWRWIPTLLVLIAVAVFSVQNSSSSPIKFFFWEGDAPLVFLLIFSFILGMGLMLFVVFPISRNSKRKSKLIRQLETRIDELEKKNSGTQNF